VTSVPANAEEFVMATMSLTTECVRKWMNQGGVGKNLGHGARAGLRGGATGAIAPGPPLEGGPP